MEDTKREKDPRIGENYRLENSDFIKTKLKSPINSKNFKILLGKSVKREHMTSLKKMHLARVCHVLVSYNVVRHHIM